MADKTAFQFGTETSAETTEPSTFLTRRRLMKGTAGGVGIGVIGSLGLWYGSRPALGAETFNENGEGEVVVETNAGEVQDVRIAPVFDLTWENFGNGVTSFGFDIDATVGTNTYTVYSTSGVSDTSDGLVDAFTLGSSSMNDYSGSVTVNCVSKSIIGGDVTTASFPTNVPEGTTQAETVTLKLTPNAVTGFGSDVSGGAASQAFDVTIDNPDGTVTASITSSNAEADGATTATETPAP